MKRIIAVFLSLLFALTILPAASFAVDGEETVKPSKSVKITTEPTEKLYAAGQAFSPAGMVLTYYDKYNENFTGDPVYDKYPGEGETLTFSVDAAGALSLGGSGSTHSVKLKSLVLSVGPKDGTLTQIASYSKVGAPDKTTAYKFPGHGEYTVRVDMSFYPWDWAEGKYHTNAWNRSTSMTLNVVDKFAEKLIIEKQPDRLSYFEGEAFSSEGMVIKVEYSDGTKSEAINLEDFAYSPSRTDKLVKLDSNGNAVNDGKAVTLTSLTYKKKDGTFLSVDTSKLTVLPSVKSLALSATPDQALNINGKMKLTVETYDASGTKTKYTDYDEDAIVWSIKDVTGTNVATMSVDKTKGEAEITAVNVGTALVTVTARGANTDSTTARATYTVTVTDAEVTVTSIGLDKSNLELGVGKSYKLVPVITPTDATYQTVTWTVDSVSAKDKDGKTVTVAATDFDKYVTVDANGTVTAVKECIAAVVTATTNDPKLATTATPAGPGQKTASCTVKVTAIPVQSITLSESSLTLFAKSSAQLTATIYPDTATYPNVTWVSLNPSVVSVDATGRITALKYDPATGANNTAIIRVTATSGVTADCRVTVKDGNPVTELTLSDSVLAMNIGDAQKLTATVGPANASVKTVIFSSNNQKVATVADDGTITAVASGTAVITVTTVGQKINNEPLTATCTVNVTNVSVGSLILSNNTLSLISGDSATVTASIYPANSTIKSVSWTSSNKSVATVSAGKITGVGKGVAIIRALATDGSGAYADCIVSVAARVNATSIKLNLDSFELLLNDSTKLVATILPATTTTKTVAWKSSDSSVVSVTDAGLISGLKTGYADITATADGQSVTIRVTVVSALSSNGVVANCKRRVNVRKSASGLSGNMGYAYLGQTYKVLGKSGNWYKIQYTSTKEAYIWANYLELSNKGSYTSAGSTGTTNSGTGTSTPVTNPTKATIVNCLYAVNVRAEASLTGTKLGYAKLGVTYTYKATVGEWCQIEYNGKTAYVHSSFCSLS